MTQFLLIIIVLLCVTIILILKKQNKKLDSQEKSLGFLQKQLKSYWKEQLFRIVKSVTNEHPLPKNYRWELNIDNNTDSVSVDIWNGKTTIKLLGMWASVEEQVFTIVYNGRTRTVSFYGTELRQTLGQIIKEIAANHAP